jgi:hypothetical protein
VRRAKLLAVAAAALLAGCYEFTEPGGVVDPLLTGNWITGPIPSGSYTSLSIHAAGGRIAGTGEE